MAELEALAEIRAVPPGGAAAGQYTWRYPLPEGRPVRLGSDPQKSDWCVPEDRMISRFHATLEWDGGRLAVARRPVSPDYPTPPHNHIWFRSQSVERCEVRPGEWFVIGQTRFTVRADAEAAPASPVDAAAVRRHAEYTRTELEGLAFSDPATVLRAMEQLPNFLRMVTNESGLFRQMLKVALAGLPRADAAAVVRVPPDGPPADLRVAVVEQHVRAAPGGGEFAPSRKLVRQAVRERKSCLRVWSAAQGDAHPSTLSDQSAVLEVLNQPGVAPWAVCTPFQDGSPYAIYVGGRVRADGPGGAAADSHRPLTDSQKFVEILVGLIETNRRTLKLGRLNQLLLAAWPTALRPLLDDPDRLEVLLRPRETDVTVLFCDIRNYSGYAEAHGADLGRAWRDVQWALDTMSAAVTEKGGIVAGFRGDAVLGFWGWPDGSESGVDRAAAAALLIRSRLQGWMLGKRCGLGLTHGRAVAGRLGAHDLGVVDLYGPVVNLAFRLEETTKAFGVGAVVSDAVAARLAELDPAGRQWRTRPLGRVRPRGVTAPAAAFELSPAAGGDTWVTGDFYTAQLPRWEEAVGWFTAGDWGRARERLHDLFEGDPAAECLTRYIDAHRGKPPPGWDGAFTPRPAPDGSGAWGGRSPAEPRASG